MKKAEFSQRIKTLDNLTNTDRRIIDYVDKHYKSIPFSKVMDICQEIAIAKSTLGRFMTKIGFSGFRQFTASSAQQQRNVSSNHPVN